MHILLIHQAFASLSEPGGTRHYELSRQLAQKGHQVSIIASPISYLTGSDLHSQKYEEELNGLIRIYRTYTFPALHKSFFHRMISFFSFMISSFFRALWIKKIDLVWGTLPPIFQSFTAWLISKVKGIPFLFEVRDLWPEFAIAVGVLKNPVLIKFSLLLEKFLYRHADRILVNSPGFISYIREKGGEKIILIPNGSDINLIKMRDKSEARKESGWPDKFTVLYAGAHGMSNDLEVILKAADFLRNNTNIRFVFIGDGKEKPNLISMAKSLGLSNVNFLDPVPKNQILKFLAASDACIAILKPIEMYKTTYPNKVFDYMAAGKPVILAIDGVIREVVESADCGIFCPPGDPKELSEGITFLYNHTDRCEQMGLNGRAYLKKHFNRKKISNQLCRIIEEMVNKNG